MGCDAFISILIGAGEPSRIAGLLIFPLIFFVSIWIAIQIHGARLLGECVRVMGGITSARAAEVRGAAGGRCSLSALVVAVLAVVAALALVVGPARADTFTVNWTGDVRDSAPGDGDCKDAGGTGCSLRAAIEEANATPAKDRVVFNIAGAPEPTTIQIVDSPDRGELDPIFYPLEIDGQAQPGSTDRPLIVLRGTRNLEWGLKVTGGGSVIRGLVVTNFGSAAVGGDLPAEGGIVLTGGGGNVITGNFIGTDPQGHSARPNTTGVVVSNSASNVIGGRTPISKNVISGNDLAGVAIFGTGAVGNKIVGNHVGTDRTGEAALGNGHVGILVATQVSGGAASGTIIGGTAEGAGNLISGNGRDGVQIFEAHHTRIQGNLIGTDRTGRGLLGSSSGAGGNGRDGVAIVARRPQFPAVKTIVGGERAGARNVISGNGRDGVRIAGALAKGHEIKRNLIGTDVDRKPTLGNRGNGVSVVEGGSKVVVGCAVRSSADSCSKESNTIAGNRGDGVLVSGASAQGVTVRADEIFKNGPAGRRRQLTSGLGIDLEEQPERVGVTANDTGDGDRGPNALMNFPVGVRATSDPRTGTTISGLVDTPEPEKVTVDLYASSEIAPRPAFGEGEHWIDSVKPSRSGSFSYTLPAPIATQGKFFSATATNPDGSTSEFSAVCGDPDRDGNTDSDGDALCDDWERYGIDFNGDRKVDLPLQKRPYGADWERKDLFVEIDYMESSGASAEPQKAGLDMVRKAFDQAPVGTGPKRGINLHLSPDGLRPGLTDEAVDLVAAPRFLSEPGPKGPDDPDDLWDIKLGDPARPCDGSFGTVKDITGADHKDCANRLGAKRLVFRYALFGHSRRGKTEDELQLGAAFPRDNDLLVTVGLLRADRFKDGLFLLGGSGGIAPQCASVETCSANVEAAVFMHELGHTLGLEHGGGDDLDFKPNYLSVMNDSFITQEIVPDRPLDYSRCRFGLLNETRLEEQKGIFHGALPACPPLGDLAGLRTAFSFPSPSGACQMKLVPAVGPIDWNQRNGFEALSVEAGIDEREGVDDCRTADDRDLAGFDDWDNIGYAFLDSEELRSGAQVEDALSLERAVAAARVTDADGDGVSNLADNCNVIANPGQADSDRDGIGDACAARITDVNLAVTQTARPKRVRVGDRVTYSITVTNDWPVAAPGTAITVTLPDGLYAREATASQGAFAAASGIWSVGTLGKRGRATLTLKAHAAAPGRLVSIAEVSASDRPDRNSIPANGDPLEDDHARAVVKAAAARGAGTISTIAGRWTGPTPAVKTGQEPVATAVRGSLLYIADAQANQVKAVDLESGLETLVAGNGARGGGGDGGPAPDASLALPQGLDQSGGLVVDAAGNVYIADSGNHRVRRIAANGTITTVAGTGVRGFGGDGGPATAAGLDDPRGLALDGAGDLYVADSGNKRVRKIDAAGKISTAATLTREPASVALRPNGNLLVAPGPYGIFAGDTVVEIARNGSSSIFAGGGGHPPSLVVPATSAYLRHVVHVAAGPGGNVYITDNDDMRIRVIDSTGMIQTWAGSEPPRGEEQYGDFSRDYRDAATAGLSRPVGVSFDSAGNGYIADRGNHRVRKVDTNRVISTIAGGGPARATASCCISGEDGPAASAQLGRPGGLAVAPNGNVVLVDQDNFSVHVVRPDGAIKRLAGLNRINCACVDLPNNTRNAWDRRIERPRSVATGANGSVYIDEFLDIGHYGFVHRIDYHPERGDQLPFLTTVAGSGLAEDAPDGGKATEGNVQRPGGIALDRAGNVYIGETDGHRVRRITPSGVVTTVAGTGTAGARGDGGRATAAQLRSPEDVEVAADGSLYVADTGNHRVRRIDASGTITTIAGTGKKGFSGDGGKAVAARLNQPSDIALDAHGNLYIADRGNHRLRLATAAGTILTIAGTGSRGIGGDGGLPTGAPLQSPDGLALDNQGQLLVSAGPLVRRLRAPSGPIVYVSDVRIREDTGRDRAATVTVSLLAPSPSPVSVRYTTANRTAIAPADYQATSGVLRFRPGETSKPVTVPIVGDRVREKREHLEIALSDTTGGSGIADLVGQVSITDDD